MSNKLEDTIIVPICCEAIKDNLSASFKAFFVIDPSAVNTMSNFSVLLQKQNKDVATKLGIATIAMVTLPIAAFYISFYFIFPNKQDPSIWSGAVAIVAVNIVIFGYVYSAFSEKDETTPSPGDAQGPRVGTFKRRTD